MNKRVFGLIGILSKMSNWNADFSGRPKSTANGYIYGSDKALKYPMKAMWVHNGEKVLYIKSYKENKKGEQIKIGAKTLSERYEELFEVKIDKNQSIVLENLFQCIDVMNFGATFAESGCNLSVTGAVQIGQGFNLYEDSMVEVQDILSPFLNSKEETKSSNDEKSKSAGNSSIGKKITSDEAHYCYPFAINPRVYDNYASILENFDGYTDDAYQKFKEAAKISATAFATNSKMGCDNEYAIFVEFKENSLAYLPSLDSYVKFEKREDENQLDITDLMALLSDIQDMQTIETIEVFVNPHLITLVNRSDFKDYTVKHILTEKDLTEKEV